MELLVLVLLALSISYLVSTTLYNLFFHPLHNFPGPKLAAATHIYEFYFDCIKSGKFIWEIQRMHEIYGPIVRINPREIHIKDPSYFAEIYSNGIQEKDPFMINVAPSPGSSFATIDHNLHRFRRAIVNPFFSKQAVVKMEHIVQDKVDRAAKRLEQAKNNGTVIKTDALFSALTGDVICHYTYGESSGMLETKDMQNEFRDAVTGASVFCHFMRFFPVLVSLLESMPWFILWLQPMYKGYFDMERKIKEQSVNALQNAEKEQGSRTIFHALSDPSLPAEERTPIRLKNEAMTIVGAGTETTARVLTVGSFHLYRDGTMVRRLRDELRTVMPDPTSKASWGQLEKLPYLTAVISESLRLAHSTTLRFPRVAPNKTRMYKNYIIPPGTPVSQSIYFVHMDPDIFPEPNTFTPDRWLEASQKGERLDRFLVPFTKGSRMCLGMKWHCVSLAYAELYLMFATLTRHFDLEMRTSWEDIQISRDMILGVPEKKDVLEVEAVVTAVVYE
ncbi:uncharacterized protein N7443_007563 [Penicillium atrosanguineum]|uniref:uncharacterized protein n=1 Tax=Penicillium atrosanguineum TaxID=1132637 RepID=UPI00238F40FE|nr:uncharacterized protein N7443_007563 [Penicillium atrosanguineum]KAJ5296670.1 hypothetical protein N7443_007563 [Penicillium atrosanguineum]